MNSAGTGTESPMGEKKFEVEKHIRFFKRCLQMLPEPYTSMDTHRMTLGLFALGGLELLGVLEENVSEANRKDWIEWIYAQQRVPSAASLAASAADSNAHDPYEAYYGFGGGPYSGTPFPSSTATHGNEDECLHHQNHKAFDSAHLTMTYAALLSLTMLGDDLSRVQRGPILKAMKHLQLESGCFIPCMTDVEADLRFVFCAAAISHILNDWSGFNREAAIKFIRQCQTYDNGISQSPDQESHGGTMFCAIATLALIGNGALPSSSPTLTLATSTKNNNTTKFESGLLDLEGTRRWCLQRQTTGFQGRINKPTDTCYSFWIGGALDIMGSYDLVNFDCNRGFLLETQSMAFGGFAKWVDTHPDVLHSYMGVAGLSLMGEPGVQPLETKINLSKRMAERIYTQSVFWKDA